MKTITRRLFAVVLLPGLLLSACGKKESGEPGSAGVEQASPVAGVPFEGIMEMTSTVPGAGKAVTKVYIGRQGVRTESSMSAAAMGPGEMSMTVIAPADKPDKIYMINKKAGTCMEVDVSGSAKQEKGDAEDPFKNATIETLGKETVNGYRCDHIRITTKAEQVVMEMWLTKDMLDYATWQHIQKGKDEHGSALAAKLRAAGLEGFPVKTVVTPPGAVTEITKVERTGVDDSLFEIPANCTKLDISAMSDALNGMSGENMKEMEEWARKMQQQMQQK